MSIPTPKSRQTIPDPSPLARRWWHEIPMVLFYVPIGFAIIAMMVRYRSFRAPLMANPGLEKGGLFPKSKQDFFALFPVNSPLLPVSEKLEAGFDQAKLDEVWKTFIAQVGSVPDKFVVKPDAGIQGQDVHFFGSFQELAAFWKSNGKGKTDWLLQEYVGGMEAAIFYNQPLSGSPGRILSMTRKWGFEVEGNGSSTVEQLIKRADADRATKRQVARTNEKRLLEIPPSGQTIDLIPVRNHHLGATFQDISGWITPELEASLCGELDPIDGYQYGRLDVRVPDFQSLLEGRDIKVLEANALYSEPVHAYDPKYSLGNAYGIFIRHWHEAVKTGLANR